MNSELKKLAELLRKRLEIIADHEFRDNDPESHLKSLEEISVAIENQHETLGNSIDARLKHYLYLQSRKLFFLEYSLFVLER